MATPTATSNPTSTQNYLKVPSTKVSIPVSSSRIPISGEPTRGTILASANLEDSNNGNRVPDFEIINFSQTTGFAADVLVNLKKPRKQILVIGFTTAGPVTFYLSFSKTNQSQTSVFVPAQAFGLPVFAFTKLIAFNDAIQNFYLSIVDTAAVAGQYFLVAFDEFNAVANIQ